VRRIAIILFLALASSLAWAAAQSPDSLVLKPSMDQRYATNLATRFLTNWHYKDTTLDDKFSSEILDEYINMLDPNKNYFLASDIASFERYRNSLDDALRHSDLTPAYAIFNVYVNRVRERVAYSLKALHRPMDFTIDEYYEFDREHAPWEKSAAAMDELWRKRVKNDYLRLKLTDKDDDAIVKTLQDRYENLDRRINELKSEDVFQFFMNAFAQSIEPHTSYLSPRTSENFEISMKLSLEGIGALLGRENEYTTIASVVPGGPAALDGRLKAGDRITGVGQGRDGKIVDVIGWRVDDVVDLIRGPKDTVVRLQVLPEDANVSGPTSVIDITRNEVKLDEQAAKSSVIEVPEDGSGKKMKIGVIDLPVFYLDFTGRAQNKPDYRSSTRDVRRLIGELKKQGIKGLVVDLRNNGGGSLLEATTMTGLFIDKGPVVQVRNANGRISEEEDDDAGMAWDGPLAVLVNRYSASASEIFAAAIQDYGRGVIIGEPTFGKGTVQSLLDLDDYAPKDSPHMGQLKITMAQFFRVNGGSTQNRGVTPDIRFPSAGDPGKYGERSLPHALPWSTIDPARYQRSGDLSRVIAVARSRYQKRIKGEEEFKWLLDDIKEYNAKAGKTRVSLLESTARAEMAEEKAKRDKRKAEKKNADPLVKSDDVLAEEDADEYGDDVAAAAKAEADAAKQGPDLLLRETAHIVADVSELESNLDLLNLQFSQLNAKQEATPKLN